MTTNIFRLSMALFLAGYAIFYWWHAFKKGVDWSEFNFMSFLSSVPDSDKSCGANLVLFGLILLCASMGFLFLPSR